MDTSTSVQPDKYAIHEAVRNGQVAVVESLLSANPRLATRRDEDERVPLHWALSFNHPAIVEILANVKDFDVDVKDGAGWTPLMIAASIADGEDFVKLLLSKGADVNAKNSSGATALHLTASKSHLSTVRLLLSHGATARLKDKRGQLPLHRAASIGSVPMLDLLIAEPARSPLDSSDESGMTALHHAIAEGHGDAAVALLKAGAKGDRRDRDEKLAIELAPDEKVRAFVRDWAGREGAELG